MGKRALLACVAAVSVASLAAPARAELGTIETVPGATLLLPYFEVDLADPLGMTTVFSIVNSGHFGTPPDGSGTAAIAALFHVTLWTDLGIPTFAFDVYHTGYDVTSINLRDVFNGFLPITASDGQDPADTSDPDDGISNQGVISQDINFASCFGNLPYASPALTPAEVTDLRNAHTGKASGLLGGNCGARDLGDSLARGFVTVDNVTSCSTLFPPVLPTTPGYLPNALRHDNLATGDFLLVDPVENVARGDTLVAIEADKTGTVFAPGAYTFYGRLVGGSGADRREALATQWAIPYQNKPAHALSTELIVWRDPIENPVPFACGGALPAPFPLGVREVVGFDMGENPEVPAPPQPPFAVVASRVRLTGPPPSVPLTPRAGWLYLDLDSPAAVASSPFADKMARQSWVMVLKQSENRFSSAHAAIQLDNASMPTPPPGADATPDGSPIASPESPDATPDGEPVATPVSPDSPSSPSASPESPGSDAPATATPTPSSDSLPDRGGGPIRERPPLEDTPDSGAPR